MFLRGERKPPLPIWGNENTGENLSRPHLSTPCPCCVIHPTKQSSSGGLFKLLLIYAYAVFTVSSPISQIFELVIDAFSITLRF